MDYIECPHCSQKVSAEMGVCPSCFRQLRLAPDNVKYPEINAKLVAYRQRGLILFWLLVLGTTIVLSVLLSQLIVALGGGKEDAELIRNVANTINVLVCLFFAIQLSSLAASLHYSFTLRVLLFLLCFLPFVNLVISLIFVVRASDILRKQGYRIGLLGADMKQFRIPKKRE